MRGRSGRCGIGSPKCGRAHSTATETEAETRRRNPRALSDGFVSSGTAHPLSLKKASSGAPRLHEELVGRPATRCGRSQ